jgi:hypothetical protein
VTVAGRYDRGVPAPRPSPRHRRRLLAAIVAIVALCAALPAWATVVLQATVETLTDRSHRIVLGTVASKGVEVDEERGRIWTTYRVRPDATWLGDAEADVVVSVPGGESGGLTQEFAGGARLDRGDRAALFLWKGEDERWLVLGEAQGAFLVRRDAKTGEDVCENRVDGLAFVDPEGRTVESKPTRLTLADLQSRVAAARKAREDRERAEREERARKIEERRRRAERNAKETRGMPGGAPAE